MKAKILFCALCVCPLVANASVPYRVESRRNITATQHVAGYDSQAFAREHRFYVGGAYNFALWDSYTDKHNVSVSGKNTSGFEIMTGVRAYDIFRLEANYVHNDAKYNAFKLQSDAVMANAIIDARIDSLYRLFYRQRLVPYVGLGAGAAFVKSDDVHIDNTTAPVVAALAGLGLELGEYFALDFGYRYFYMFSPKFDEVSDLNPSSHQFRVGARVNF